MAAERVYIERPCIDCGDPTCNDERCRDCDIEYLFAVGSCRDCGRWIVNELATDIPATEQHAPGCSLAESDDYGPRTSEEITVVRSARLHNVAPRLTAPDTPTTGITRSTALET